MPTDRQKGANYEREIQLAFQSEDWLVCRAYPSLRRAGPDRFYASDTDFFNCFDLICTRLAGGVLWVQVTTEGAANAHRRKMEGFLNRLGSNHPIRVSTLLVLRYPKKFWRWQAYDADGKWFDVKSPVDLKAWVSKRKAS